MTISGNPCKRRSKRIAELENCENKKKRKNPHRISKCTADTNDRCRKGFGRHEAKKKKCNAMSTYSQSQYRGMFEDACKHINLDELEQKQAFRIANQAVNKAELQVKTQSRAIYGRTMTTASEFLLHSIGSLKSGSVFCDLGHGVGNLAIQAAYTLGCQSRGIELVKNRHSVAMKLNEYFQTRYTMPVGASVELLHGNLADPVHRTFLTDEVDLMFCNNFNDIMNTRANLRSIDWYPDDYIAGLFTQLKPGAKLVTLYPIKRLPPSLHEATDDRLARHMMPNEHASFFNLQVIPHSGGDDNFTFCNKPFQFYVYTRIGPSAFLCSDPSCPNNSAPLSAYEIKHQLLLPVTHCPNHVERRRTRRKALTKSSQSEGVGRGPTNL